MITRENIHTLGDLLENAAPERGLEDIEDEEQDRLRGAE